MYSLMGFATTMVTLYTAYVGLLFCLTRFPNLPDYYIWSIRFGILIFVVFAFEGFVMGSRLTHTIGGEMGGRRYSDFKLKYKVWRSACGAFYRYARAASITVAIVLHSEKYIFSFRFCHFVFRFVGFYTSASIAR